MRSNTTRTTPRLRLKDPRVPGTLLLLLTGFACHPGTPSYPMGGVKNTLDDEITVRGRARGTSFDASVGQRSTLWVAESRDDDVSVEVFSAPGATIDRSVSFHSYMYSPDRYEVVKTEHGFAVRRVLRNHDSYRDPYNDHYRDPVRDPYEYGPQPRY